MQTRASDWKRSIPTLALGAALALGLPACGGSVGQGSSPAGGSGGSGGSTGGSGGSGGSTGGSGGSGAGCDSDGVHYAVGESFPAPDGCNTCTCQASGAAICSELACSSGCDYNGQHYQPGESWSLDACNSCFCGTDGSVACTGAYCPPCTYAGQQYDFGQTFQALDGCNTCSCDAGGVSCTELACACDPANEWWQSYTSTDPAFCATLKYACPPETTAFQNACGCGCVQDSSCPPTVDCTPAGTTCDLAAKCPYSNVLK
jgi:Pacifastin inhibitor (LCMII)